MTSGSQPTASSNTSFTRLLISLSAFFNLFIQCSWRSENRRGHILKYCSIYQRATMRWSPLKLLRAFSLVSFALAGALVLRRRSHFYDDAVKNTLEADSGSAFETIDSMSNNKFPGRFNLMEDASWFNGALKRPIQACSLELVNSERLQQDHPCVIENIRQRFLHGPDSREALVLDEPLVNDPTDGQAEAVLHLLNNKTNGFFVECGASDGERLSSTLYMERFLNWTGLLIELDQNLFKRVMSRKRKSWASSACLSDEPYPQEIIFRAAVSNLSRTPGGYGRDARRQCFPLYSMLLAVNRTAIDYLRLDAERHEVLVLKTIPFQKVDITVLTVKVDRTNEEDDETSAGRTKIIDYLKEQGYELMYPKKVYVDDIFVKRDYIEKFLT